MLNRSHVVRVDYYTLQTNMSVLEYIVIPCKNRLYDALKIHFLGFRGMCASLHAMKTCQRAPMCFAEELCIHMSSK